MRANKPHTHERGSKIEPLSLFSPYTLQRGSKIELLWPFPPYTLQRGSKIELLWPFPPYTLQRGSNIEPLSLFSPHTLQRGSKIELLWPFPPYTLQRGSTAEPPRCIPSQASPGRHTPPNSSSKLPGETDRYQLDIQIFTNEPNPASYKKSLPRRGAYAWIYRSEMSIGTVPFSISRYLAISARRSLAFSIGFFT